MKKTVWLLLLLASPLLGQPLNPLARTVNNGLTNPVSCNPKAVNIFLHRTGASTADTLSVCTAANVWSNLVVSGGSGGFPLLAPNGTAPAPSYSFSAAPTMGLYNVGGVLNVSIAGTQMYSFSANTLSLFGTATTLNINGDVILSRPGAANWQFGAASSATPTAQTVSFQGTRGGTDSNIAGTNSSINSSLGTGNAAGAQLNLSRAVMQATGTTQQTALNAIVVCESKTLSNTSATTTTIANISLPSNSGGGMRATINLVATDGTNFDSETQDVTVSYVNKAGAITVGAALITTSTAANNSGSATIGATVTGASPTISLKVTPVFTTIVPTTVTEFVTIFNGGVGNVTCQ